MAAGWNPIGACGAVSRLGERRRRTAHCQRRDCGDGPAYWQALTTGHVELPRRRIHAGLWFRLLRTLLDELNTPLSTCGTYAGYLRQIWECCGHPLRAGQSLWRPYETLNPAVRLQMLEAAATAISLIEVRDISPPASTQSYSGPSPKPGSPVACRRKRRSPNPSITGSVQSRPLMRPSLKHDTTPRRHARCSRWLPMVGATPLPWNSCAPPSRRKASPRNFCHIMSLAYPLHALDRMTG